MWVFFVDLRGYGEGGVVQSEGSWRIFQYFWNACVIWSDQICVPSHSIHSSSYLLIFVVRTLVLGVFLVLLAFPIFGFVGSCDFLSAPAWQQRFETAMMMIQSRRVAKKRLLHYHGIAQQAWDFGNARSNTASQSVCHTSSEIPFQRWRQKWSPPGTGCKLLVPNLKGEEKYYRKLRLQ